LLQSEKITLQIDLIENRSIKNPLFVFIGACTIISYTAREPGEIIGKST
jgi:hypothetical protein